MKIIEITEKNRPEYEKFLATHPLSTIHQTWEWGLFQSRAALRDKFWVYAVEDAGPSAVHNHPAAHDRILASALVIRQNLPFGKCWLYCPRGPIGDYAQSAPLKLLFEKIASIAREQRAVFLRFDPPIEAGFAPQLKATFSDLHARPAHAHYQPESTLIMDLRHEPSAILSRMKPKGRYNIKVAQKHGVTVQVSEFGTHQGAHHDGHSTPNATSAPPAAHSTTSPADLEAFYALLRQTTERDGFSGHPLSYYKNMMEVLAHTQPPAPSAKLYLARHDGKVLAGMIATYFRDTATYYFGASSSENRHTMAPYLLHWQAIQDARAAGYHYYDFFGIAPEDRPESTSKMGGISKMVRPPAAARPHPWQKVTEFKLKFGGERVNYLPAQEIIYSPFWYAMIRLAKWSRGILRK